MNSGPTNPLNASSGPTFTNQTGSGPFQPNKISSLPFQPNKISSLPIQSNKISSLPIQHNNTSSLPIQHNNTSSLPIQSNNPRSGPLFTINASSNPFGQFDIIEDTENSAKKIWDYLSSIFNQSNVLLLVWFLAIYFVIHLILGIFYPPDDSFNSKLLTTRIFDMVIFTSILLIIIQQYFFTDDQNKWSMFKQIARNLKTFVKDPNSIFSLLLFIFVLYLGIFVAGISMTYKDKPISIMMIESGAWILLSITLICTFFNSFLNVDLASFFSNSIGEVVDDILPDPSSSKSVGSVVPTSINSSTAKLEVFNVSDNVYTYDDAQAVCKAYGARLANYDDMEDAYNNGAEWCNYGWSDNQMIFFPTQKDTWTQLQKDPTNANKCGRPGINGGYMDNPYLTFGVNCFGVKPTPTADEIAKLNTNSSISAIPETPEQQQLDQKVQYWKQNQAKMNLNAFNQKEWSEYS